VDEGRPGIGVLISGRGSNLQAILEAIRDGRLNADLRIVISSRADAAGLDHARRAGVETLALEPRRFATRELYDRALADALVARGVRLVCLAGFMRIVGPELLKRFPDAILNVHPSLLPAFPGLEAQRQAWEYGVKVSGATVHIVDEGLDSGPIVLQSAVPVLDDDTPEALAARILVEEHRLYPEAIGLMLDTPPVRGGRRLGPARELPRETRERRALKPGRAMEGGDARGVTRSPGGGEAPEPPAGS